MGEQTRYSDAELEEFAALINEKLNVARENLGELRRALSHQDDNSRYCTHIQDDGRRL